MPSRHWGPGRQNENPDGNEFCSLGNQATHHRRIFTNHPFPIVSLCIILVPSFNTINGFQRLESKTTEQGPDRGECFSHGERGIRKISRVPVHVQMTRIACPMWILSGLLRWGNIRKPQLQASVSTDCAGIDSSRYWMDEFHDSHSSE